MYFDLTPRRKLGTSSIQHYIRLPKQGAWYPLSGLPRGKLNELIRENPRNNFNPPVKNKSIRKQGDMRGSRPILEESLLKYPAKQPKG